MVVTTAQQLRSTYLLWERFSMPTDRGARDAISVPTDVSEYLISAYTILCEMIFASVWGFLIVLGALWVERRRRDEKNHELTVALWNTRDDLVNAFSEVLAYMSRKKRWRTILLYGLLSIIFSLFVAHYALSIYIPRFIILEQAAPVNADAIFIPPRDPDGSTVDLVTTYQLEVPAVLRAAGSADVADEELRSKVHISEPTLLGNSEDGERIQRIEYSYNVSGTDFGLQHHPDLELRVEGACTTEYGWFNDSDTSGVTTVDYYNDPFGSEDQIRVSLFDGPVPVARFRVDNESVRGNISWAAFISSINRFSWTVGEDPWYLTVPNNDSGAAAPNTVKPLRPALSCWQSDAWWYNDEWRPVTELNDLPGLNIKPGIMNAILRFLSEPRIVPLAARLGGSALVSSGTTLGQTIDAGASSIHTDLQRLILAAYISTSNTFTDMTQFARNPDMRNDALDPASGNVIDGAADFVVWTPNAQALSILFTILIPSITLGIWIITLLLFFRTPLRKLRLLSAVLLYEKLERASERDQGLGEEDER